MDKVQLFVGFHNKGDPYPTHDFSAFDGEDVSWVPAAVCVSNEKIVRYLEEQYAKKARLTKTEYYYYLPYVENKQQEETCP